MASQPEGTFGDYSRLERAGRVESYDADVTLEALGLEAYGEVSSAGWEGTERRQLVRILKHWNREESGGNKLVDSLVTTVNRLNGEVERLTERVGELESFIGLGDKGAVVSDPLLEWCAANLETLKRFPNSFIAIAIDRGVVVAAKDAREFEERLSQIPDDVQDNLLLTHTSEWL